MRWIFFSNNIHHICPYCVVALLVGLKFKIFVNCSTFQHLHVNLLSIIIKLSLCFRNKLKSQMKLRPDKKRPQDKDTDYATEAMQSFKFKRALMYLASSVIAKRSEYRKSPDQDLVPSQVLLWYSQLLLAGPRNSCISGKWPSWLHFNINGRKHIFNCYMSPTLAPCEKFFEERVEFIMLLLVCKTTCQIFQRRVWCQTR